MSRLSSVLWERADPPAYEHSFLSEDAEGSFLLSGNIVGLTEELQQPFNCRYEIICSPEWKTRSVNVQLQAGEREVAALLYIDDDRRWWMGGQPLAEFDGLDDVDLEISPSTNTLPIRRLSLAVGESAEITAAWLRFPGLGIERLRQRYTRLAAKDYLYEAPDLGFSTRLVVNAAGIVETYGDIWRRR